MKLFTFGTLLLNGIDSGWLGDAQRTRAAVNATLWTHPSGRPLLHLGGSTQVIGELVHDLTPDQLQLLDSLMGVIDGECERAEVQAQWGLSVHAAITYHCAQPQAFNARPYRGKQWRPRGRLHRRALELL